MKQLGKPTFKRSAITNFDPCRGRCVTRHWPISLVARRSARVGAGCAWVSQQTATPEKKISQVVVYRRQILLHAYVHTYNVCKETYRVVPGGYQANQSASRSNIMKRISLWSVDRDDTLHIDDEI